MRRTALTIFSISALFAGLYYFSKCRSYEHYRIKPLDAQSNIKKSYQININLASEREFENLPGIGPRMAHNIVADREARGRFSSPQDITRVKGIGEKKLAKFIQYLKV